MGDGTLGLQALTRAALALLLVVVLAGTTALAGEAEPPGLRAAAWDLLPINELERQELARDHPALAQRVALLVARQARLRGHLAGRADAHDDGSRKLAQQIAQIDAELTPLLREAVAALADEAIDARLLAHIAKAPGGPYHRRRYAMSLALFVEGMPDAPRRLLAHLLPRVDGALLALRGQHARLAARAAQADLTPAQRAVLQAGFERQVRSIENRWWRVVDYVVPATQRVAIHQRLPGSHQRQETILQHVFALPGLSASQALRVRAVLEEVQSQAAPDSALLKRLQVRLAEAPAADGAATRAQMHAAQQRLITLQRWAVTESKTILTAAQWQALEAIPPRVTIGDRKQTSPQVLDGMRLSPRQGAQLAVLRRGLDAYRAEYRERRLKAGARMADMGPDSPQMAGAMMAMASIEADGNVVQRRFNGRVLLEVLTAEQVTGWVLGLSGGNR